MILINVLAELEHFGIKYDFAGADEVKVVCPFHDDTAPSCNVNVQKRVFRCPVCKTEGSVPILLARKMQVTEYDILLQLSERYQEHADKTVPPELVDRYHSHIWQAGAMLQELYKRGLTDADIREFKLGIDTYNRISIPIPNEAGEWINVRSYLPGAKGAQKMRNMRGHGEIRLFPVSQLRFPKLLLVGGECKAIVALRQLNPHGIGVITATAGEGAWEPKWNKLLKGKELYVCQDIDKPGQEAANIYCLTLRPYVDWVGNLVLPLDHDKYPKGDISDFIGQENGQLFPLIETIQEYVPTVIKKEWDNNEAPQVCTLTEAVHAENTGKRLQIDAVVSAVDESPYFVPRRVKILCKRNAKGLCSFCPVHVGNEENPTQEFDLNPESPEYLELIVTGQTAQYPVVKQSLGIPLQCQVSDFEAVSHYNVEDARISSQLEIIAEDTANASASRSMQPAFCIGEKGKELDLNETYELQGRLFPHPRTQQATFLVSKYQPTTDALSNYHPVNLEELGIFWPREWSEAAIGERLGDIYNDFSCNVTRIYQRPELHYATDLTYHSPLKFLFDDKVQNGWLETLIVGDSSQGKSEVTCGQDGNGGLKRHFGLGTRVDCKNATVAGLLGGVDNDNKRSFVSWGLCPQHDRRLIIFEELKGMHVETFAKFTDMRSSGIAEIPKIKRRKTFARVRKIVNSNARFSLKMSQYSYGIQSLLELVGAREDLRRFDLCLVVNENDIDAHLLNKQKKERPKYSHNYTAELCRKLILWGWTRRADQVIFSADATEAVLQGAGTLLNTFTTDIPIVDSGSIRLKLAKQAAALAVRTFSASEDMQTVIVEQAHVEYALGMMIKLYSRPSFGYLDYTAAVKITETMLNPEEVKEKIYQTAYPQDLCKALIAAPVVDVNDLRDWCASERDFAQDLMSLLVRKHCLMRAGKFNYRKTGQFIAFLRGLLEANNWPQKPAHIRSF